MTNILTGFIFALLALNMPAPLLAQQSEEERAVLEMIKAETASFATASLAATADKFWVLDSHSVRCVSYEDGNNYQHRYLDLIESSITPPAGMATFEQTEAKVRVMGTMASASYNQQTTLTDGTETLVLHSREVVVAEKVNGQWRIHMKSVHYYKKQ
jgi:hypothetical protein